jgi:Uncharacterized conserved protein (some members contain a von Willebrand factor type A (vWA) domain)
MNRLVYVLSILLLGYVSVFYETMHLRTIFVVAIILPIVLYGILRYQRKQIEMLLFSDVPLVRKNMPFIVKVIIDNYSKLPATHLDVELAFKNELSSEVKIVKLRGMANSESTTSIDYDLNSDFCGKLSVKVVSAKIYDVLGITYSKLPKTEELYITVMPQIYDVNIKISEATNIFAAGSNDFDINKSGNDTSEIFNFREYRAGDRLSHINWKASAKSRGLVVKEFSDPIGCNVLLLLDFFISDRDRLDIKRLNDFIEIAASISSSLINNSCHHYISWYSEKQGTLIRSIIRSKADLFGMLEQLLSTEAYKEQIDLVKLYNDIYVYDTYASRMVLDMNFNLQNNSELIQLNSERVSADLAMANIIV